MSSTLRIARVLLVTLALAFAQYLSRAADGPVYVILWFDTEDYLLPADDDACKRLADLLTERQIRATFKVVGEKARVLERRGRQDVIDALKRHDLGFHANFHSVHPTPSEYLAECGLLDGIAEFARREGGGAADVRRVFGVDTLVCYGQPGSSWAPQAIAALPSIGVAPHGVPCYVDEGDHVGLNEQPFWFAGALNVYHMGQNYTRMELHDPAAVEPAKQKVSAIAARLSSGGGGLISIFYHPCEWVHREFWDGVNFRRGANPPREQWKPPPQRTAQETDAAFVRFESYIDHIRSIPGIRFITATNLPTLYPDPVRAAGAPEPHLARIAQELTTATTSGIDYLVIEHQAYSPADQFELLTLALDKLIGGGKVQFPLRARGLLGPENAGPGPWHGGRLEWPAFRETVRDVAQFLGFERRVPARVFIGADSMSPGDFLLALANAYHFYLEHGQLPTTEGVLPGTGCELLTAKHVAADTPEIFGGWIIHKEGFRAPKILEQARLQAWTLKPAIREDSVQ